MLEACSSISFHIFYDSSWQILQLIDDGLYATNKLWEVLFREIGLNGVYLIIIDEADLLAVFRQVAAYEKGISLMDDSAV